MKYAHPVRRRERRSTPASDVPVRLRAVPAASWFRAEALERRLLLAFAPVGEELGVSTFNVGDQLAPSAASDREGNFVVAWSSDGQDGSGFGAFARRFSADGMPRGEEFGVNTVTDGNQFAQFVAVDPDGNFVVTFVSNDVSGFGVYARLFAPDGTPRGVEFAVNSYTSGTQSFAPVAMDGDGNFVVAWQSNNQDGSSYGVYARRYDAAGAPRGNEFRVNVITADRQLNPSVAVDADGDFVVAWHSAGQDGSAYGVYARRYDTAGVPKGGEFRVNVVTSSDQSSPAVAVDDDGDFVIAWQSYRQDGAGNGIYARRYDAAGAALGGEFRVNTFTAGDQSKPAVAVDADGDFVVSWQSLGQSSPGYDIYARRYSPAGTPQGEEFLVNTFTDGRQAAPSVASDPDGDIVVTWESAEQDGFGSGVYAQIFGEPDPAPSPRVAQVFIGSTAWTPAFGLHLTAQGVGEVTGGFAVPDGEAQMDAVPWNTVNQVAIRFDSDVVAAQDDLEVRGVNIPTYAFTGFAYDRTTRTATWTLGRSFANDKVELDLRGGSDGVTGPAETGSAPLDGEWSSGDAAESYPSGDGVPGSDFRFQLHVLAGDVTRNGVVNALDLGDVKRRLNSTTTSNAGAAYRLFADVTGDGRINALDLGAVKLALNRRLPAAVPAATWPPPPTRARRLTETLFGAAPVLA